MRIRLPLVASVSVCLLAACSPDSDSSPSPYLELVGSTRFVSANRSVTSPGDTLTTRLYAEASDAQSPLRRLLITVSYEPNKNPILYTSTFDPTELADQSEKLVYLDTTFSTTAPTTALAYQFTFGTRTTSGREVWRFEAEDTQQRTASRSYRLTLRTADSALVYHRYNVRLQAPQTAASRSFLSLLSGLALPKVTVRKNPEAQELIDLIYLPTAAGAPSLSTLTDDTLRLKLGRSWSKKRATQLRLLPLSDSTSFANANTAASFTTLFNQVLTPSATSTGPLREKQIIAFQTEDKKYGLIQVVDIKTTPTPTVDLQIRIAK
ncbi:hypothetical protein [Hymenobacter lucidus]|uniref:DUF4270 family protein n=1 Tax=Hymenobacter lucidus TaxID=2880930 RepID=A0ABS8AT04_9BACT|nr:hypothetical protein [Hymenobacter lucidus]MCB2409184.1 hypothetical protein [Hymenobacter lucidus]